jgi:hypothetical protein
VGDLSALAYRRLLHGFSVLSRRPSDGSTAAFSAKSSRGRNCLADSLSEGCAAAVRTIPKSYPHGRVVARALDPSYLTIDPAAVQALPQSGTQKDVVETQAAVAFPSLLLVIPEGIHGSLGWSARIESVQPCARTR